MINSVQISKIRGKYLSKVQLYLRVLVVITSGFASFTQATVLDDYFSSPDLAQRNPGIDGHRILGLGIRTLGA